MESIRFKLLLIFMVIIVSLGWGQNHQYYVTAISESFTPEVTESGGVLVYTGKDRKLSALFNDHDIYVFVKAFPSARGSEFKRTYYVEANTNTLETSFTQDLGHVFNFAEYIGSGTPELLSTYPNDYGQTGPQGAGFNLGYNLNLHAFDYAELPTAWDYTTGDSSIVVGISDAQIDLTDPEFSGRITSLDNNAPSVDGHGLNVLALAGAKGDNANASVGYCYDCDLNHIRWTTRYDGILALSYAGVRVINCSWAEDQYSEMEQKIIDSVYANNSIVVAGAGNTPFTEGKVFYPASYNKVISASSVGAKYDQPTDSIYFDPANGGSWRSENVKGYLTYRVESFTDPAVDPNAVFRLTGSTATLNDAVDIVAPMGTYLYGRIVLNNPNRIYAQVETSSSAPQVSGTLGLMLSLNSCLSFEEAESILKAGSTYIGNITANQVASGKYGSGALNAGNSVKLTHDLMEPLETAYIENQKFNRWDFIFNAVSEEVVIQNQEFSDASTLTLNSKNEITLGEGTILLPDQDGFAVLSIDPTLVIDTNCTTVNPTSNEVKKKNFEHEESLYKVYPTLVQKDINVINTISDDVILKKLVIYDIFNQLILSKEKITTSEILLDVSKLAPGIYILKGFDFKKETILSTKFIKR